MRDRPRYERKHLYRHDCRKNYYRHALRHENIEKAQAVFPEPVTDHNKEYEQRKGNRDDQLARNGEGIRDEPDQVSAQNEHEQRKDEGKKLHPFGPGRIAHGIGDKLVGNLRNRLQPPGHDGAAGGGADHEQGNQPDDNEHIQA